MLSVLAVFTGAGLGALLRWFLGVRLNPLFPTLPLGTLAANLTGGLLIGLAITWLGRHPGVPPETRLLIITGFLGGLTTFSTFSAEVVNLFSRGESLWGLGAIGAHVAGSLAMTALGMALAHLLLTHGLSLAHWLMQLGTTLVDLGIILISLLIRLGLVLALLLLLLILTLLLLLLIKPGLVLTLLLLTPGSAIAHLLTRG